MVWLTYYGLNRSYGFKLLNIMYKIVCVEKIHNLMTNVLLINAFIPV